MWQSEFRCFDLPKFLEDFYFIHANDAGKEEHPRGAPSPFSDDTSWAHCGTLLGNSPDVREAKYRQKWVADPIPSSDSPHFDSARARSRQPKNHHNRSISHLHQKQTSAKKSKKTPMSREAGIPRPGHALLSYLDQFKRNAMVTDEYRGSAKPARVFENLDGRDN